MSVADTSGQVRPSARWYIVVGVAWLAAAVCTTFAVKPVVDALVFNPISIENRSTVGVTSDGLTIYASTKDQTVLCDLTDAAGGRHRLDRVSSTGNIEVDGIDGGSMYPIATTPKDLAVGQYTLRCQGAFGALGYGDRVDWDGLVTRVGLLIVLAGALGVAGLALLIVLLVRRHNSKERLKWAQQAYAGWGYAGGYPGYGQPGQQAGQYTYPYGYQAGGYPGYSPYGYPQGWAPDATPPAPPAETDGEQKPDA